VFIASESADPGPLKVKLLLVERRFRDFVPIPIFRDLVSNPKGGKKYEAALILGIVLSIFLVPRSFSVRTFMLIAASIIVVTNILLFSSATQATPPGRHRMSARSYLALGLVILFWVLHFFMALASDISAIKAVDGSVQKPRA